VAGGAGVVALSAGAFFLSPFGKRMFTAGSTDFQQAQALLVRYDKPGNVVRAESLFLQVLSGDSRDASAHAGLAQAYLQQFFDSRDPKLLEQASNESARALELNATVAGIHVVAGRVQLAGGHIAAAQRELQRAVELDPRHAGARAALGEFFNGQGMKKEAEAAYGAAVDLGPDDWRWHYDLGVYYRGVGQANKAMEEFQKSLKLTPDNQVVLRSMGEARLKHDTAR